MDIEVSDLTAARNQNEPITITLPEHITINLLNDRELALVNTVEELRIVVSPFIVEINFENIIILFHNNKDKNTFLEFINQS